MTAIHQVNVVFKGLGTATLNYNMQHLLELKCMQLGGYEESIPPIVNQDQFVDQSYVFKYLAQAKSFVSWCMEQSKIVSVEYNNLYLGGSHEASGHRGSKRVDLGS